MRYIEHFDAGALDFDCFDRRVFCIFPHVFRHGLSRHPALVILAEGGVVMEDKLYYGLPLGILGEWARRLFIDSRVEAIFAYREKVLANRFGR